MTWHIVWGGKLEGGSKPAVVVLKPLVVTPLFTHLLHSGSNFENPGDLMYTNFNLKGSCFSFSRKRVAEPSLKGMGRCDDHLAAL